MSAIAPVPVLGPELDSRLLDALHDIGIPASPVETESKPLPLGKALKSELKYHRLQKEQNENSPSSTARTTPVPSSASSNQCHSEKNNKRKRPRRNPVWNYFEILENIAYCQRCPYSTRSVFSTNLKVHLKSHHPEMYRHVIAAEYQLNSLAQCTTNSAATTNTNDSGQMKNDSIAQRHPLVGSLLSNLKPVVSTFPRNQIQRPLTPVTSVQQHPPLTSSNGSSCEDEKLALLNDRILKRKRLRRHPVWNYFNDVDDKSIGCNMCEFKTVSGFTTNLKMHLRAHHKSEYVIVMNREIIQRKEEGCVDNAPMQGKRKKRTAEEIEKMLNVYKGKLEKEAGSTSMMTADDTTTSKSNESSSEQANDSDTFESLNDDYSDRLELSPSEFINQQIQNQIDAGMSNDFNSESRDRHADVEENNLDTFRIFMKNLIFMNDCPVKEDAIRQARDIALGRFINAIGGDYACVLNSNAFVQLLITMDPNYSLPDEDSLKKLADSALHSQQ